MSQITPAIVNNTSLNDIGAPNLIKKESIGQKISKIFAISYTELWDRISYYGLQAFLVLYLTEHFKLSDSKSYAVYGTYTALSYGLTVLGGVLADKVLGFFYASVFGIVLIIFGNLILAIPHYLNSIYIGLAVMVVGVGLLKPNNPSLLGTVYKEDSIQRTRAFSALYLCISLGSICGPVFYGLATAHKTYWIAFIFSAFGLASALPGFFYLRKNLNSRTKDNPDGWAILSVVILLLACVVCSVFLLKYPSFFVWFLSLFGIIFLMLFSKFFRKLNKIEKFSVFSLFIPIVSCIIYLTAFLQIYSSLTLFIDRYVDKNLFGWNIPTMWFSSLEPAFIFVIIPLLDLFWAFLKRRGKEPGPTTKVIIGLVISGVAFLVFSLATIILNHSSMAVLALIVLGNMLLSIGELCLIPVTMSLTNMKAPKDYRGTMMGIFYFSLMLSGYLSGEFGEIVSKSGETIHSFTHLFVIMSLFLLLAVIFLSVINSLIGKIKHSHL